MKNDISKAVATVNELVDIDEISDVIALFLSTSEIFPGSEYFDDIMDNFFELINENIKMKTVFNLKKHLDEYE
jgi:hypothetical protein